MALANKQGSIQANRHLYGLYIWNSDYLYIKGVK